MRTRLILVRHAQAEGNVREEFHGWTDGDITKKGHLQAQCAATRLKDFKLDVLYSSPLKRAVDTAQYISYESNLPVIKREGLKEINGGDWDGLSWKELQTRWPEEFEIWSGKPHMHRMPNGESMMEFLTRLVNELGFIMLNNRGKNICIVTHGMAIRVLMSYFHGVKLENTPEIKWIGNASITVIDYEDDKFIVTIESDYSHLGEDLLW
ncbi:MAG TPA: histidine phosphatase family protein [Pseudobacteroides sp.]|uniref:histidine phosphatase family protein n=1 Tax=Pseudobacteroides sp. TaxID=1968840 RepID=UPI002F940F6C